MISIRKGDNYLYQSANLDQRNSFDSMVDKQNYTYRATGATWKPHEKKNSSGWKPNEKAFLEDFDLHRNHSNVTSPYPWKFLCENVRSCWSHNQMIRKIWPFCDVVVYVTFPKKNVKIQKARFSFDLWVTCNYIFTQLFFWSCNGWTIRKVMGGVGGGGGSQKNSRKEKKIKRKKKSYNEERREMQTVSTTKEFLHKQMAQKFSDWQKV